MKSQTTIERGMGQTQENGRRRGAFVVLAFFCLVATLCFVAMSMDLGVVTLTKTNMQNAVDAAALAAAQEITAALENAADDVEGENVQGQIQDANAIAEEAARAMAAHVADLNGVYVNPETDVRFGKRVFNGETGQFEVQWGVGPYNAVGVTGRRDNPTPDSPDAELDLFFAPVMGHESVAITADAVAYVEARDIVVVLDYSGSMSYDSEIAAMSNYKLGKAAVEANLDDIWDTLKSSQVRFSNRNKKKFRPKGFGEIDSYEGTYISSNSDDYVYHELKLDAENRSGKLRFPWPQEGKYGNGNLKGQATGGTHEDLWKDYIRWVRTDSTVNSYGYRKKYGYRTLMAYMIENRKKNHLSEDLWRAPIYPFHAMKNGMTLFTEFLDGLEFGDHLGLVTYDNVSRVESVLDDDGIDESVDLGDQHITDDYEAINTIQRHKQAGHYDVYTGLGYGIESATDLLIEQGRYGARPTLLVMTDGNANRAPSGWSMPNGWNWSELTDYDDNGSADYTTYDRNKQYAFWQAKKAIDAGFTIHTLTVGQGADRDLMQAIAHAGGGIWIDVPGGSTVAEMESQMLSAFSKIAANVPPAKLARDPSEDQ